MVADEVERRQDRLAGSRAQPTAELLKKNCRALGGPQEQHSVDIRNIEALIEKIHSEDDIQCAVACDTRAAMVRAWARCMAYPFVQLQLPRVSAEIELENERSIRLAEGLGFQLEGIKRGAGVNGDVGVFGLLRDEFKLRKYMP